MKNSIRAGIILVAVIILFVLSGRQCQEYRLQMQKLQGELDEKKDKIVVYNEELDSLRAEFEKYSQMEEYTTETGFVKKGGVYLIDDSRQLESMSKMIKEGAEIESGVAAATASYRLRNDLNVRDWFSIGTGKMPFCGSFDGDGHTIKGKILRCAGMTDDLFYAGESAKIENLEIDDEIDSYYYGEVSITVEDEAECEEMENHLAVFINCQVQLSIKVWDMDTQKIADALKQQWEKNQEREDYYVSVSFDPQDEKKDDVEKSHTENAMTPFLMLAGEEYGKIIEEALKQEEGYVSFIRLENIAGIRCCTFEIREPENRSPRSGDEYHIILEGEWEGKQISMQHLIIPYTEMEMYSLGGLFDIENEDINFDGKQDLLIHEGVSGGSGGSWCNYRAAVFKEETGQFEYYPSFPEQLVSLEFDRQRVVSRWRLGAEEQYVAVYGVVDGEYVCTEELIWKGRYKVNEERWESVLSYYQMGKLVREHIVTGMKEEEWEQLYPDLDYWLKG